jgi:predicted dehydrogenase
MQKLLRVGVIGAGRMGSLHLRKLSSMSSVRVAGFFDPYPHVGSKAVERHEWEQFSTLEELAFESDAVVIASPTATHFAIAKKMLELDVDVLVEKPICETVEEAKSLVEFAERRGRILQVGFLERFRLRNLLADAWRGTPMLISAERFATSVGREPSVDVVSDLMIHDLDLVLSFFIEDPSEVFATGVSVVTKTVDIVRAVLKFPSGASAFLAVNRTADKNRRRFGVASDGKYVSLDFLENEAHVFARERETRFIKREHLDPLQEELSNFLLSCGDRRRPVVSGADAVRSLNVRDAILNALNREPSVKLFPPLWPSRDPEELPL